MRVFKVPGFPVKLVVGSDNDGEPMARFAIRERLELAQEWLRWRLSRAPRRWVLLVLALIGGAALWPTTEAARGYFAPTPPVTSLAPLFTPEVTHWGPQIEAWATIYELEPNLLATVMQIESCGHPTVNSSAGAQGLFQVMPFHFADDEDMLDPDTNAKRGAAHLNDCLRWG
ncbi:MAG: lytic transglycosylase domain-containing protein, partial [Chloroflexota bacterium]